MKFTFVLVGRAKEAYLREAYADYLRRLQSFGTAELIFIEETTCKKEPSAAQVAHDLDQEAERVLKRIPNRSFVILADLHGSTCDSVELSGVLKRSRDSGAGAVTCVVGSSYGLSDLLRAKADFSLCLSKLTFTHPLAMLLMLEQIYRANLILANSPYHK